MSSEIDLHKSAKDSTYVFVWLGLIGLTGLTINIAGLRAGMLSLLFPLLIATAKAYMVFSYFMCLQYEKGLFKVLLPVAILIFAILIWLVFSDVVYR